LKIGGSSDVSVKHRNAEVCKVSSIGLASNANEVVYPDNIERASIPMLPQEPGEAASDKSANARYENPHDVIRLDIAES
jgi:hypothetical protein